VAVPASAVDAAGDGYRRVQRREADGDGAEDQEQSKLIRFLNRTWNI